MHSYIDHLVVMAPDLDAGSDYIFQQLGIKPQAGGTHVRMGTHNRLLSLGDSLYLEIISIDPYSFTIDRPRWFELDKQSADVKPRLITWVVRTNDIYKAAASSPVSLGKIEPMSRGDLHWLITIPPDGSLPFNGMLPVLIQWQTTVHPASRLAESNCSLVQLEIFHPQAEAINKFLKEMSFSGKISIQDASEPKLSATIKTSKGVVTLL